MTTEMIVAGIVAMAVLVYLLYTLVRPERF
ncbi:MAG TPA: potassium-transporting ATPase subunit F [Gemmatimonadaceae bacterium]|nr:potassium-transporting ATPase subunit F [Gemmatimonadaceae bacterium]